MKFLALESPNFFSTCCCHQGRFILGGEWEQFFDPKDDATRALSVNAVEWLAGGGKSYADVRVAHRDYSMLDGHTGDGNERWRFNPGSQNMF